MTAVSKLNLMTVNKRIQEKNIVNVLLDAIKNNDKSATLSSKELFVFCMATMSNESLMDNEVKNAGGSSAKGLGQIKDKTMIQLVEKYPEVANYSRFDIVQGIDLVVKLVIYSATLANLKMKEMNKTYASTSEKIKFIDFTYAMGIGSFKNYIKYKDVDITTLNEKQQQIKKDIDNTFNLFSNGYYNDWLNWYNHYNQNYNKILTKFKTHVQSDKVETPPDTKPKQDKQKNIVLTKNEALITYTDHLLFEATLMEERKPGAQVITQAEKNLALENAITNGMYQKISNILSKQKLNNFVGESAIAVVLAIMSVESRCDIKTQQDTDGTVGVMQVSSVAAEDVQEESADLTNVDENIRVAIKYMNRLMKYMKNNVIKDGKNLWDSSTGYIERLAWMCLGYNNGMGNIKAEYLKGTTVKNTIYYNDVKEFYNFWSAESVLQKVRPKKNENVFIHHGTVISERLLRNIIKYSIISHKK